MPVGRPIERGRRHGPARWRARLVRGITALLLVSVTASCAYYNTFYLARKYYMKATDGLPYEVDREGTTQRSNYTKSSEYSKKLIGVYPNSKYVDDAWLMWARSLVGTDDPLKAVAMLQEFQTRFPKSELRPDAEFFLGLAYRLARKHELAVASFDDFLVQAPKHQLVPYAYYERSKALMSLQRYGEAAASASMVVERFSKHAIADKALHARAEARFQQQDWAGARDDFHTIGGRALTDDERLKYLLREVDCLESSRSYDEARSLLREARSHVPIPPPLPVMPRVGNGTPAQGGTLPNSQPNQQPVSVVRTPAEEQYGRLTLRMGGVELLDGHVPQAIELYRSVFQDYPRSQLSAEAQYRIGYAYETGADDFEKARVEYSKVKEQTGTSQFTQQAQMRLDNLDRIDKYRSAAGADSLERKAEARFLIAEHYLFNLNRPERALEEYRAIFDSSTAPSVRGRALNAEAWLLARKLDRKPSADSLFWKVVHDYPATEAQLAARDYLEAEGHSVPESLIVLPKGLVMPMPDTTELTQPPGTTPQLGATKEPSLMEPGAVEYGPGLNHPGAVPVAATAMTPSQFRYSTLSDSLRRAQATRDSLIRVARSDTSAAGRARVDSLRYASSHPDTTGRAALQAEIANEIAKGDSVHVEVAPDTGKPPNLSTTGAPKSTKAAAGGVTTQTSLPTPPKVGPPPVKAGAAAAGTAAAGTAAAGTATAGTAAAGTAAAGTAAAGGAAVLSKSTPSAVDSTHLTTAAAVDSAHHSTSAISDTTHGAVRRDSTHTSMVSPKRVYTPAVVTPPVEKPVAHPGGSMVSWDVPDSLRVKKVHLTSAQKDSVKREKVKFEAARHDSLQRAHATRDSLKHAAKQKPAVPDSTQGARP